MRGGEEEGREEEIDLKRRTEEEEGIEELGRKMDLKRRRGEYNI